MPVQQASIFGPMEIGLLLLVVLLLFGAKRIPEIAGSFGKGIKEFKKSMEDGQESIQAPSRATSNQPSLPHAKASSVRDEHERVREPKRLL